VELGQGVAEGRRQVAGGQGRAVPGCGPEARGEGGGTKPSPAAGATGGAGRGGEVEVGPGGRLHGQPALVGRRGW
jgi:hypothetical protein